MGAFALTGDQVRFGVFLSAIPAGGHQTLLRHDLTLSPGGTLVKIDRKNAIGVFDMAQEV
ncbi:MAG: hypothetical protein Kow0074_23860 [Candidatus Zixiibacteriota bacterium]